MKSLEGFHFGPHLEACSRHHKVCPQHRVDGTLTGLGCLLFNSTTVYTWEGANSYCQAKENATLVEIWTSPQSDSIASELMLLEDHEEKGTWWTGVTDFGREGDW